MHEKLGSGTLISVLLSTCALSAVAVAQDNDDANADTSDVIIVEGQRLEEGVTDIAVDFSRFGTQVQLIDSSEIETGGFTNFGEAAAGLIRGANIGYSPDEGEFTIRIDGGTDRDTLLLVDGVPYFDRSSPLEDLWPATAIDPRMIDSVEVYRGGNSLYFGSNGGLGVVSVRTEEPDGTLNGEVGFYAGSFKTREMYGNVSFPLDKEGKHSVLLHGRSYETDAHELFDREAYTDNILELGGRHEFPYSYNSIGAKYLWKINEASDTELLLGAQFATIDFRDSFPWLTVYQPNRTEFPIYNARFQHTFSDRIRMEAEAHYQEPRLHNTELDAQTCNIPRVQDLSADAQAAAEVAGITSFANATEFEDFAAANGLPAGCVTNPYTGNSAAPVRGIADDSNSNSFYVDENGVPYGTIDNPFPIGAPIGTVIQSRATFGSGEPTKGFGTGQQYKSGYKDWGFNGRTYFEVNENVELVGGFQYTAYTDYSAEVYGVRDVTLAQYGFYGDVRVNLPILDGFNASLAGRYDINNEFEDQQIYKFGVRQNFARGFYARASGGTSYSLPKIDEIGAFGANSNINPGLQPQEVDTLNVGAGIDGQAFGGTFNIELGYFDTEIENLFSSRELEDVCFEYSTENSGGTNSNEAIERNRSTIIPTDEFCATAFDSQLDPTDTVSVNTRNLQDIEGFTVDFALDLDLVQMDISYTNLESLEDNPRFEDQAIFAGSGDRAFVAADGSLTATDTGTPYYVPGQSALRQSSERPEWSLNGLITFTPTDRWTFALNPRYQGPEFAYQRTGGARLVDADGNRTNQDLNFGEYFLLNASIQYFMGDDNQHRILLRGVNLTDEDSSERAGGADQRTSRAAVRGEISTNDPNYYYMYEWNTKPRSFFIQYEYQF